MKALKDILIGFHLKLVNCRGHTFSGSGNIMGKNFDVSKQITDKQTKMVTTHFHGHSLNVVVKSLISNCNALWDIVGTTIRKTCLVIKFSLKCEKLLGKIAENIEYI